MAYIIIGLGYFGNIIKSKLEKKFNTKIVTVDPCNTSANYKTIDEIHFTSGKWFVTSPANTHHDILIDLFNKGIKDIWVEKPICPTLHETLDIFAKKPDDVFLYCDFTWLQHNSIKTLGENKDIKHIEMKWLNDGSMIPRDVNIVSDLAIHPISILTFLLMKSLDRIKNIDIIYATNTSVLINGISHNNTSFNIEVSNSSLKKYRNISLYCKDKVYRWSSLNEFFIENIGTIEKTDAIEENIKHFLNRNNIGYPLDIARSLEIVNIKFNDLCTC
jgi:predicted dehydrogenase